MRRWAPYLLGLAAFVGMNVSALGEFHGRWIALVVSLAILAALVLIQTRRLGSESRSRDYRRTYEASSDATYSALYGAVIDPGYRATAQDPASGTLRFRTASRDPWMPRADLDCKASVRQVDDNTSEVVLAAHADLGARGDYGRPARGVMGALSLFLEGPGSAMQKILNRLDATVVTYAVVRSSAVTPRL